MKKCRLYQLSIINIIINMKNIMHYLKLIYDFVENNFMFSVSQISSFKN